MAKEKSTVFDLLYQSEISKFLTFIVALTYWSLALIFEEELCCSKAR